RRARVRRPRGARGIGLRGRRSQGTPRRKSGLQRPDHLHHHVVSQPRISRRAVRVGGTARGSGQGACPVNAPQEVWITGVGLITCLGEGLEANWQRLMGGGPPPYDDKSFAPYVVHPLAPINFDKQIPKKSDQR